MTGAKLASHEGAAAPTSPRALKGSVGPFFCSFFSKCGGGGHWPSHGAQLGLALTSDIETTFRRGRVSAACYPCRCPVVPPTAPPTPILFQYSTRLPPKRSNAHRDRAPTHKSLLARSLYSHRLLELSFPNRRKNRTKNQNRDTLDRTIKPNQARTISEPNLEQPRNGHKIIGNKKKIV